MTSRERVLSTLDHIEPDRVPLDIGGTFVTTCNIRAYSNLLRVLGISKKPRLIREQSQTVFMDEEVRQLLDVDVVGIYERPPVLDQNHQEDNGVYISEWGIKYIQSEGKGSAYSIASHPLRESSLEEIVSYPLPDPHSANRFKGLSEEIALLRNSPYAVAGNLDRTEIFDLAWFLRGFETFMIDLVINKELAHALLRRITDFQKKRFDKFLEIVGSDIDIILFAEDLAGQQGLFLSPALYREMIKPYHAELFSLIRERTSAKILFHSCGAVSELIDDFIEIGMDILNPIQVTAKGMNAFTLKKRYGKRLIFWGGIDSQITLPYGTTDEVRTNVKKSITELGGDGGYIAAATHVIQADVKPENILELCKTVTKG